MAARHADWVVGYVDEVWWSRLAQPAMHAWGTLRLHAKARTKDDPQPKALACYGLLRTDQDRVTQGLRERLQPKREVHHGSERREVEPARSADVAEKNYGGKVSCLAWLSRSAR